MSGHILEKLHAFAAPNVFNPWGQRDPLDLSVYGPDMRRERLEDHFDVNPSYLLVGEAPGYQGCHFSGVPFTNEALLCEGRVPRIGKTNRITSRERPWREPSATIVWNALHEHGIADDVVLWNSFAFHPHRPGEPMSNRAPTREELRAGLFVLRAVLEYFKDSAVIAVGRVAEKALGALGIRVQACLRHPSMGGANEFRAGLAAIVAKRHPNNGEAHR